MFPERMAFMHESGGGGRIGLLLFLGEVVWVSGGLGLDSQGGLYFFADDSVGSQVVVFLEFD